MQVPASARLEIKFVTYRYNCDAVVNWLRMNSAGFHKPFPDRIVNNVYFDTFNYKSYAENLSGVSERTKVRYRWYGDNWDFGPGNLEVKCKRNYFGWKLQYKVNEIPEQDELDWNDIKRWIWVSVPAPGRVWLMERPMPILINRYLRQYYVSCCDRVRATIDSDQIVWDQRKRNKPNLLQSANVPDTIVVEFKFGRDQREFASKVLRGIPIRVSRHSKYINLLRAIAA